MISFHTCFFPPFPPVLILFVPDLIGRKVTGKEVTMAQKVPLNSVETITPHLSCFNQQKHATCFSQILTKRLAIYLFLLVSDLVWLLKT